MTREELATLSNNLLQELKKRESLGGYGADAEVIKFLTASVWMIANHLVHVERNIARLKRPPKKKK